MSIFSANKETKRVLRDDVALVLRLIADCKWIDGCPLTDKGQVILKLLWKEQKSFNEVAKELDLSQGRVRQIYNSEIRRLIYFLDSAFKGFNAIKDELEQTKKEIKEMKEMAQH